MPFSPATIAAQRADLLRQVVFNRPDSVPSDDKRLFSAEIGLTVHAYMADVYAAALAELNPERAEEVARELAEDLDAGPLPGFAWQRAVELGHNPQAWVAQWKAGEKDRPLSGPERLHTQLAKASRDEDQLIRERDQAQQAADKLAYAIAPVEDIGEHSDHNDPWDNAHEELHRQRQELADTVMMRDFNQRSAGLTAPRLYGLGFPHNNCGGACIKAGQAQWKLVLDVFPERYADAEASEEAMRADLGKDIAFLRDRRGGVTKPLPLKLLRTRLEAEAEQQPGLFDDLDWGGCGCLADLEIPELA